MTPEEKYNERRKWFMDRIGKRIYRPPTSCTCKPCEEVTKNGLIVLDEYHADYLQTVESEYPVPYFDTMEEVEHFLKTNYN